MFGLGALGLGGSSTVSEGGSGRSRSHLSPARRLLRRERRRRIGAALCLGLAVYVVVLVLRPAPPPPVGPLTVVAVRDLPVGAVIGADDLALEPRAEASLPRTATAASGELVGKVTVVPVAAREVLTRDRVQGPSLLAGQPRDRVAVTVPVAAQSLTGIGAGGRVDVYRNGSGTQVATGAVVLAVSVPAASEWQQAGRAGSVTLAVDAQAASRFAAGDAALGDSASFLLAARAG